MSRQDTNSEDVRLSKSLSWVLRHGALSLGLDLSPDGYARVNDILALPQFKQFGRHDVERIVSNNSKKRFCLKIDIDGTPLIRANQGHSLAVPELELEEIKDATRLSTVVHGSYYSSWPSIQRSGLSRMSRQHVHFALGELSSEITSGMRGDCDLLVFLDLPKALKAGLKFFRSANGVILTPGDERGYVSTDLFSRVVYKPALGVRQELPIKNL